MKVIQVAPSIAFESSGPSYSVPGLCLGLVSAGCELSLHLLDDIPPHVARAPYRSVTYPRREILIRNLGRSPDMLSGLMDAATKVDILHSNGLWMMPNVYPAWVVKSLRRRGVGACAKIVVSPRGALAPWSLAKGKWKKKIFGAFVQYPALRFTDMFHATSEKEYAEIRSLGYRQPVAIVPIGMDVPKIASSIKFEAGRIRKVAFFGRLHKVKGVDRLLSAWKLAYKEGWELVIAGPDCGMLGSLKKMVVECNLPHVSFVGEINGADKYEFLAGTDIYVLPSETENFGVTVAEALACSTPVIASQGTPWQGLEREGCGRWVPIGVSSLVDALTELMAISDEERLLMGKKGRMWILRDFAWDGVGRQMRAAYSWLLGEGPKPDCVYID